MWHYAILKCILSVTVFLFQSISHRLVTNIVRWFDFKFEFTTKTGLMSDQNAAHFIIKYLAHLMAQRERHTHKTADGEKCKAKVIISFFSFLSFFCQLALFFRFATTCVCISQAAQHSFNFISMRKRLRDLIHHRARDRTTQIKIHATEAHLHTNTHTRSGGNVMSFEEIVYYIL